MTNDLPGDDELIVAIKGKDTGALEVLYNRHRTLAYSLAFRMLGNTGDAEDVVQESFLNVWRSSETYRQDRSNVRSWVMSIVHNRSIDKMRGRQSRVTTAVLDEGVEFPDDVDVWREVSDTLSGEDVARALNQLPAEQREAIELAYFKGYTHSQIAQLTSVPLGTVKGRMRIGLHKLKSLLAGSYSEMASE